MSMYGEVPFGLLCYLAILVADGSASMGSLDYKGVKKYKAIAQMIQDVINELHDDPEATNILLTVICYDSTNYQDIRLDTYDVKSETYYQNTDTDLWNPLKSHGSNTPIGKSLGFARTIAEQWILQGSGMEQRRCVIYLLSDGMNNDGPDGLDEKAKIESFNTSTTQGRIRLATVGYFQDADNNPEEADGRKLLQSLVTNPRAYCETPDAFQIVRYIKDTITNAG